MPAGWNWVQIRVIDRQMDGSLYQRIRQTCDSVTCVLNWCKKKKKVGTCDSSRGDPVMTGR